MGIKATMNQTSRQTKYMAAAYDALQKLGHATNAQILDEVQRAFPEVSATTIHRVTARMKQREVIGCAPKSGNGSERYDANPLPHHHFMCAVCDKLCDIADSPDVRSAVGRLKRVSSDCVFAESLTLQGTCKECDSRGSNE